MLLTPYSSYEQFIQMEKSLQMWVKYQNMDSMRQVFQWDETQLGVGELSTSYLEKPLDKTTLEYLKTKPTRNDGNTSTI